MKLFQKIIAVVALLLPALLQATFIHVTNKANQPVYVGVTPDPGFTCTNHEGVILPYDYNSSNPAADAIRKQQEESKGVGVVTGQGNWTLDGCDGKCCITDSWGEHCFHVHLYHNYITIEPVYDQKSNVVRYDYKYSHQ